MQPLEIWVQLSKRAIKFAAGSVWCWSAAAVL